MTAMRVEELPAELGTGLLGTAEAVQPEDSAVTRAAVRWIQPAPAAETVAYGPALASPAAPQALPRTESASVPLRLTRRGRIVAAVMATLLLAALSLIIAKSADATSQPVPARAAQSPIQVTVQPGESLWAVAENADPNADTRVVVQQITELNALTGPVVFAGERLYVPRG
jgi:LysM repeat protein